MDESERTLPDPRYRVCVERGIRAHQREPLKDSLSDQEPVERVAVMKGERIHGEDMLRGDIQCIEVVPGETLGPELSERAIQGELARAQLDGDFPGRHHTDHHSCGGVLDGASGARAQPRVIVDEPKKSVSVEEEIHGLTGTR